jgi:ribose transport system substrate-binding protein
MRTSLPDRGLAARGLVAVANIVLLLTACSKASQTIAVIPRTCGTPLWEPVHAAADSAARARNYKVYWNAPTQENETQAQIAFLQEAVQRKSKGIIIVPDETLPFRTPVLDAADKHIPVVVIDTELDLPRNKYISYILNDEVASGELAARRIGTLLRGSGSIVIIGINPRLHSMTTRERSLENALARDYPGIQISARRLGDLSVPHEQEIVEGLLHSEQKIGAIVALSTSATRGAYYALLESNKNHVVPLIGFDQDMFGPIRAGEIDSIIIQNTYKMGKIAVEQMDGRFNGKDVSEKTFVQPVLLTLDNLDLPEVQQILSYRYYRWAPSSD